MGAWFWINWGGGEWSCVRKWWQHSSVNCWNVNIFIGGFPPRPNFAPLSPNIGLGGATHSKLHGTKKGLRHARGAWQKTATNHWQRTSTVHKSWSCTTSNKVWIPHYYHSLAILEITRLILINGLLLSLKRLPWSYISATVHGIVTESG